MNAKTVRHVSFTNTGKRDVLRELDYKPYYYSGKLNDAPNKWRHYYRDLKQGYYLVTEDTEKPIRQLYIPADITRDEERQRYLIDQAFQVAVAREIAYNEKGVFVEVDNEGNAEVFELRDATDFEPQKGYYDRIAEWMGHNYRTGYYFYRDSGDIVGTYNRFDVLLFDAIMEGDHKNIHQFGTVTEAGKAKKAQVQNLQKRERGHSSGTVRSKGTFSYQRFGQFHVVMRGKELIAIFANAGFAEDFVELYV